MLTAYFHTAYELRMLFKFLDVWRNIKRMIFFNDTKMIKKVAFNEVVLDTAMPIHWFV